mgnify:CR=1 FL=1
MKKLTLDSVDSVDDETLDMYIKGSYDAVKKLNELEDMAYWEVSIALNSDEDANTIFNNKDTIIHNHGVIISASPTSIRVGDLICETLSIISNLSHNSKSLRMICGGHLRTSCFEDSIISADVSS